MTAQTSGWRWSLVVAALAGCTKQPPAAGAPPSPPRPQEELTLADGGVVVVNRALSPRVARALATATRARVGRVKGGPMVGTPHELDAARLAALAAALAPIIEMHPKGH